MGTKYDQCFDQLKYWSKNAKTFLCSANVIRIDESLFLKEIERLLLFAPAVLLNSSESTDAHAECLQEMIDEASREKSDHSSLVMPLIAYGQLPPPIENRTRTIKVQFVFTSNVSIEALELAKVEIGKTFNIESVFSETRSNILNANISSSGNIPMTISKALSMLTDLDVKAVLVGNFGMEDFHHAMRPEFNRIYSVGGIDREPGFEPNYFDGSIDHGESLIIVQMVGGGSQLMLGWMEMSSRKPTTTGMWHITERIFKTRTTFYRVVSERTTIQISSSLTKPPCI